MQCSHYQQLIQNPQLENCGDREGKVVAFGRGGRAFESGQLPSWQPSVSRGSFAGK